MKENRIKPLLEACTDSCASCRAAALGDADRLELCAHLAIGGVTPSPVLFKQVKRICGIRIHVLIRPRFGDFLYTEEEMEQMCEEIQIFREMGADGIVIGALTPDGDLDTEKLGRLMDCAGGMNITLHRAFDMTRDPYQSLDTAIRLGFGTILTSGQEADALAGSVLLGELYRQAAGRIDIMAGCGVRKENIRAIYGETGILCYHTTGRRGTLDSGMRYRKSSVSMGLPSLSEYEIWKTDEQEIRECAQIVHSLG